MKIKLKEDEILVVHYSEMTKYTKEEFIKNFSPVINHEVVLAFPCYKNHIDIQEEDSKKSVTVNISKDEDVMYFITSKEAYSVPTEEVCNLLSERLEELVEPFGKLKKFLKFIESKNIPYEGVISNVTVEFC